MNSQASLRFGAPLSTHQVLALRTAPFQTTSTGTPCCFNSLPRAFHMFCHEDAKLAREIPRPQFEDYFKALFESAGEWTQGTASKDYKGYGDSIGRMKNFTLENQIEARGALVGTPDEIKNIIRNLEDKVGKFESASLQINFGTLPLTEAQKSMRLFAREVMPAFAGK